MATAPDATQIARVRGDHKWRAVETSGIVQEMAKQEDEWFSTSVDKLGDAPWAEKETKKPWWRRIIRRRKGLHEIHLSFT